MSSTSGSCTTGSSYSRSITFNWSIASQNKETNKTIISWNIKGSGSASGYVIGGKFKLLIDDKQVYYSATRIEIWRDTVVASGTYELSHDSVGDKTFSAYLEAAIYYSAVNVDASGSWELPRIQRYATITSAPDFNDEQNPTITYKNPAGNIVDSLQVCIAEVDGNRSIIVPYRDVSKTGTSYTFNLTEAERTALRNSCTNAPSRKVGFYIKTIIGDFDKRPQVDKTLTIVNANPAFSESNVSYMDSKSNIVAVTQNNQKLVQGLSNLLVTITSATAKKGASIINYSATINEKTLTTTGAGNLDFGIINSSNNLELVVKVTDSRGFTTTVKKNVTFLGWVLPSGVISLSRLNNYENTTYLKVKANYSSVDGKNILSIKYQYKKTNETSYSAEQSIADNTQITLNCDKNYAWDFKIKVADSFGSVTYNGILAKGKFIVFYDTKKLSVGVNGFPTHNESLEVFGDLYLNGTSILQTIRESMYPIGSIYMSVNNTSPATIFGGTWEQIQDRFLLSAGTTYSAGSTGGEASHVLTTAEMPAHTHSIGSSGAHTHTFTGWLQTNTNAGTTYQSISHKKISGDGTATPPSMNSSGGHTHSPSNTGGGGAHNNMPPYLAVYVWKRTA